MSGDGGVSFGRVSGLSNGSSLAAASGTSIRRDRRRRDPQVFGALAGADADAALDFENDLETADISDRLTLLGLPRGHIRQLG